MIDSLSSDTLSELVSYDPTTGNLTWCARSRDQFTSDQSWKRWNTRYAGTPAFTTLDTGGYRRGKLFGRCVLAHRVAWAIFYGNWPIDQLDHINGQKTDNRIENLREVTNDQNGKNQKLYVTNSSGYPGVRWRRDASRWVAKIVVSGKQLHLGYFKTINQAVAARCAAEIKYGFHQNHGKR